MRWLRLVFGVASLVCLQRSARAQCFDPYWIPPRPECQWNAAACDYDCPSVPHAPARVVSVLRGPTASGAATISAMNSCQLLCGTSVPAAGPTTASARCEALRAAFVSACGTRYTISENACATASPSFKIAASCGNVFVGIASGSATFDESYLGPLPDGEQEAVGTTAVAAPVPALPWPALPAAALALAVFAVARLTPRRKRPRLFL
jgi:hypothetical protein